MRRRPAKRAVRSALQGGLEPALVRRVGRGERAVGRRSASRQRFPDRRTLRRGRLCRLRRVAGGPERVWTVRRIARARGRWRARPSTGALLALALTVFLVSAPVSAQTSDREAEAEAAMQRGIAAVQAGEPETA